MRISEVNFVEMKRCVLKFRSNHSDGLGTWKDYHVEFYIAISRARSAKTWMNNIKEDLNTKNLNIRTAMTGDRTRLKTLVQTHRQPS